MEVELVLVVVIEHQLVNIVGHIALAQSALVAEGGGGMLLESVVAVHNMVLLLLLVVDLVVSIIIMVATDGDSVVVVIVAEVLEWLRGKETVVRVKPFILI